VETVQSESAQMRRIAVDSGPDMEIVRPIFEI
jgi:hypothetical protein